MTTPKIKPPRGYRLLKEGEVIRKGDKVHLSSGLIDTAMAGQKMLKQDVGVYLRLHPLRRPAPSAAECLKWLGRRAQSIKCCHNDGENFWVIHLVVGHELHRIEGRTPLAAVRRAMKAGKRGGK